MTSHMKNSASTLAPASNALRSAGSRRISGTIHLPAAVTKASSPPELPQPQDESVGATGGKTGEPIQQACRDLTRDLQDTDRGAEADRTEAKLKR
jgi:hypothetical protein